MGKKGKGGSKKKQAKEVKDTLPEVDKEFYEIQIADLNKKLTRMGPKKKKAASKSATSASDTTDTKVSQIDPLVSQDEESEVDRLSNVGRQFFIIKVEALEKQLARYRARCAEVETNYDDAVAKFKKQDEDRSDIIAYLKRTVQNKVDEIAELNERNLALKKSSDAIIQALQKDIQTMKEDHRQTESRMMAEINLLNGKLSSLEEFRAARDDLNNKFVIQEQNMVEQEDKYKQHIYELEKEHLLSKNTLRKEMESKLVQLSTDFQKTTKSQIAVTTQNLIRENIAINNELFLLIGSWQEIYQENEKLKERLKDTTLCGKLTKNQLETALSKNATQTEVVEKLVREHARIISFAEEYFQNKARILTLENVINKYEDEKNKAVKEVQRLAQEKHMLLMKIDDQIMNFNKLQCHNSKLERIINKATMAVQEAIGMETSKRLGEKGNEAEEYAKRQSLLVTLLDLLTEDFVMASQPKLGDVSVPTIDSMKQIEGLQD